jgi:AraC family transcriptional regulator
LLSQVHLGRVFKFAFGRTIGAYIRSRKLAVSIEDLLHSDSNVLDIALKYGFGYEQTYIRAFKHEFKLTPGDLRKTGQIVKITPPLQLFDSSKLAECPRSDYFCVFGPDMVIIPQFHAAGKNHKVPFRDALASTPRLTKEFFDHERMKIPNTLTPNVCVNFCREAGADADFFWYMPSLQVKTLDNIPEEFDKYTFPASLCAKFSFIGPGGIPNIAVVDGMFKTIDHFMEDENQKYFLERKRINFWRCQLTGYDGVYSQWEWFAPVMEKKQNRIQLT